MGNTYWDTEIETLSQDRLRAYQLARLSETVLRAYHGSVYYRRIMDEKGIRPHQVRYLEDLERFPFLNKQIIRESQERQPPLGDLVAVPETEIVYTALSSGSTGVPTASPFTRTDFDEWMDYEARLYWSTGMRPADRYVHAISMSLFCGGPVVLGAQRLGAMTNDDEEVFAIPRSQFESVEEGLEATHKVGAARIPTPFFRIHSEPEFPSTL